MRSPRQRNDNELIIKYTQGLLQGDEIKFGFSWYVNVNRSTKCVWYHYYLPKNRPEPRWSGDYIIGYEEKDNVGGTGIVHYNI